MDLALTNSHVVAGRKRLLALTAEGDRLDAEVVGDDPSTDLALVRWSARDLPYARIADAARPLKVGQLVIAVGSPYGLESTVSTGVVGAGADAPIAAGRLIENVVQHTSALNPGNSGGPLVNSRRAVGINSTVLATPMGPARVWDSRYSARPRRGSRRSCWPTGGCDALPGVTAGHRRITHELAKSLDLLNDWAVEVGSVESGSPASRAGRAGRGPDRGDRRAAGEHGGRHAQAAQPPGDRPGRGPHGRA